MLDPGARRRGQALAPLSDTNRLVLDPSRARAVPGPTGAGALLTNCRLTMASLVWSPAATRRRAARPRPEAVAIAVERPRRRRGVRHLDVARRVTAQSRRGPRFADPIGVPCATPPSRRPSSAEPSARGSGQEKKLRGADGAAAGRVPQPRRRAGKTGATRLVDASAAASHRRADPNDSALRGADVKRRRRRRAGRWRPRGPRLGNFRGASCRPPWGLRGTSAMVSRRLAR